MNMIFKNEYDAQVVNELRQMCEYLKKIGKQKPQVNISNNVDVGHELWRMKNLKW